jgi:hypothetical protein
MFEAGSRFGLEASTASDGEAVSPDEARLGQQQFGFVMTAMSLRLRRSGHPNTLFREFQMGIEFVRSLFGARGRVHILLAGNELPFHKT